MKANDCLRRIRYILDLDDTQMIAVFAQGEERVTRAQLSAWLKKDDDQAFEDCSDAMFASFLDGLINQRRGKKVDGQPAQADALNNNVVFRKLKIAFNLQADDILSILLLAELSVSKHELSAFFRRADHKHYRECKDQILRNFLKGMQIRYRGESQREDAGDVSDVANGGG